MPESRTGAAVSGDRRGGHRWRALLTSLAVVLVVATVPVAVWAVPVRVPPTQAGDDAENSAAGETVADGRARLPRGDIAWTLRQIDVPAGEGFAVQEFPIGFALVDEGTVTLREEDEEGEEEPAELGEGEAAVLPDGNAGTLTSVEVDSASVYEIALVSTRDIEEETGSDAETGAVVGEPFPAPEGERFEIALVRNTLSGDGEAAIPVAASGAPVFYLTTEGTAQLQAGEQVVDLTAGQFALLAGEVQVRAAGDAPATFVVAAIGEEAEERDRGAREERQRQPRERAGGGGGGGSGGQSDRAARRAARQAARAARQAQQGQGGRGGGQGQTQQPGTGGTGAPVTGGVEATGAGTVAVGTPGADPTPEPTLPADPTVPSDGTPPPGETPPVDQTVVPTATVPAVETPTPAPTVPVVPTNPPVPAVPGLPTVPAEETVVTESVPTVAAPAPEETLPVEEAPAAPAEEEQSAEPSVEE